MRSLQIVALATSGMLVASGCAITKREWGTCTMGGAAVGAIAGGIAGGALANNVDNDPTDSSRGGWIGGGIVGGGVVGALLGHLICDPVKEVPPVQAAAPPPPSPPAGTKVAELRGTNFAFNSARLTPEGESALGVVVSTMREHPDLHVRCEGYTDSVGSDAYNQALGQRRADTARQYIVDQGIDGSRIEAVSFGESKPVADNSTAEGRARNRRVEIVAE
jgi:outer membrane protein OmpA-like peptidoglycan-associated protein